MTFGFLSSRRTSSYPAVMIPRPLPTPPPMHPHLHTHPPPDSPARDAGGAGDSPSSADDASTFAGYMAAVHEPAAISSLSSSCQLHAPRSLTSPTVSSPERTSAPHGQKQFTSIGVQWHWVDVFKTNVSGEEWERPFPLCFRKEEALHQAGEGRGGWGTRSHPSVGGRAKKTFVAAHTTDTVLEEHHQLHDKQLHQP